MTGKRQILIVYNSESPGKVVIHSDEQGDPWGDIALLLEAIGILTTICLKEGKIEHKGQPLNEYLKSYVDKVYNACHNAFTLRVIGGDKE